MKYFELKYAFVKKHTSSRFEKEHHIQIFLLKKSLLMSSLEISHILAGVSYHGLKSCIQTLIVNKTKRVTIYNLTVPIFLLYSESQQIIGPHTAKTL